jgi:hypothetical protein
MQDLLKSMSVAEVKAEHKHTSSSSNSSSKTERAGNEKSEGGGCDDHPVRPLGNFLAVPAQALAPSKQEASSKSRDIKVEKEKESEKEKEKEKDGERALNDGLSAMEISLSYEEAARYECLPFSVEFLQGAAGGSMASVVIHYAAPLDRSVIE